MLFDLRGKRKNFIRVVYMLLAVTFGASLVLVGAGSDVGGGLLDSFRAGGGDTQTVFDDQIEAAQKKTEQSPKDAGAWLELARSDFQLANSQSGVDEDTGQLSDRGEQAAIEGIAAWERYLRLSKGRPNATTAQFAAQTYGSVGDAKGALEAQQVVIKQFPDRGNAWAQLALFAYASGENTLGDRAQAKAISLTDRDKRNTARSELEDQEKQAKEFRKEFVKAQKEAKEAQKQAGKDKTGGEAAQPFGQPLPGQGAPGGGL